MAFQLILATKLTFVIKLQKSLGGFEHETEAADFLKSILLSSPAKLIKNQVDLLNFRNCSKNEKVKAIERISQRKVMNIEGIEMRDGTPSLPLLLLFRDLVLRFKK